MGNKYSTRQHMTVIERCIHLIVRAKSHRAWMRHILCLSWSLQLIVAVLARVLNPTRNTAFWFRSGSPLCSVGNRQWIKAPAVLIGRFRSLKNVSLSVILQCSSIMSSTRCFLCESLATNDLFTCIQRQLTYFHRVEVLTYIPCHSN